MRGSNADELHPWTYEPQLPITSRGKLSPNDLSALNFPKYRSHGGLSGNMVLARLRGLSDKPGNRSTLREMVPDLVVTAGQTSANKLHRGCSKSRVASFQSNLGHCAASRVEHSPKRIRSSVSLLFGSASSCYAYPYPCCNIMRWSRQTQRNDLSPDSSGKPSGTRKSRKHYDLGS